MTVRGSVVGSERGPCAVYSLFTNAGSSFELMGLSARLLPSPRILNSSGRHPRPRLGRTRVV